MEFGFHEAYRVAAKVRHSLADAHHLLVSYSPLHHVEGLPKCNCVVYASW